MANPIQALNENFFYNSMLARALTALLPAKERDILRAWLDTLHEMDGEPEDLNIRNDYMWFLLLVLQNKKVAAPFDSLPPGIIKPLREILPPRLYEEILTASDQNNMSWLDQVDSEAVGGGAGRSDTISAPPAAFLNNQPVPKAGFMCYMAAFSDHD